MELDGKVAIVTGGAGALGGAIVAELLDAGAMVCVPYTNADHFTHLQAQVAAVNAVRLHGVALDLTDETAVSGTYAALVAQHGGLGILVNAAGGFGGGEPLHATPWQLWQQQLDANLKTTVLSCAAGVPHMLAHGGGAIVNVSSRTALQSGAYVAAYGAAKRAVIGVTEALAAELSAKNITANALLPSVIDTPANRAAIPNADFGLWVQPREIARVVRFLVGPDARVISGASVPVYGRA